MTLENFINEAISPWMREKGPENDIVLSTRIRLARNLKKEKFPIIASEKDLDDLSIKLKEKYNGSTFKEYKNLQYISMSDLTHVEKRVLVEKHLISAYLAKTHSTGVLICDNEQLCGMSHEEDHRRIQMYFRGFQGGDALDAAFSGEGWLDEDLD